MITSLVAQSVRRRAADRCEYCRVPQDALRLPLQIDHVIALQHGGSDLPSNLALACSWCNLQKGTNLAGVDRQTGQKAFLFDPRSQFWADHFQLADDGEIVGRTNVGRATVVTLALNDFRKLRVRAALRDF